MMVYFTDDFTEGYEKLPPPIRKRVDEKLNLLLLDPRHPSLRIKKMKGFEGIWEGRISRSYRFTFQMEEDAYILRKVGTHEIFRKP